MVHLRVRLALSLLPLFAGGLAHAQEGLAADSANRDEIVHVLNRITFGPRPGDVAAVEKMGLHAYIEQQLHPESIDDSAVTQQLAGFDLLQMSAPELTHLFEAERKKALEKTKKLNDEAKAAEAKAAAAMTPAGTPDVMPPAPMAMPAPQTPKDKLTAMLEKVNEYRSIAAIGQLEQAKLVRAINSERQLQEVLVDFWGNHFNIDMKKQNDRVLKVDALLPRQRDQHKGAYGHADGSDGHRKNRRQDECGRPRRPGPGGARGRLEEGRHQ